MLKIMSNYGRQAAADAKYDEFTNKTYLLNLHVAKRNILILIYYYY